MNQSFYLTTAKEMRYGSVKAVPFSSLTTETVHVQSRGPSFWTRLSARFAKRPKPVAVPISNYSNFYTLTSFGGADLVVNIDGESVGELQAIEFLKINPILANAIATNSAYADRHLLEEYPVIVVATYATFDSEPIRGYDGSKEMDISMTYANEYGNSAHQYIIGARVLSAQGGTAIDDIVLERQVVMMARSISPLEQSTHIRSI